MTGKQIHAQVEKLRESGNFDEAIALAEKAKEAYEQENDMLGLSDLYGSISLTYRHLNNLEEAKKASQKSVELARQNNLKGDLARPLYNLAKVEEDMGDLKNALQDYRDSIRIFKEENPKLHNRSGVLADMKIHLGICEYKNGDESAIKRILLAIEDLEKSGEKTISKYNYDVWMSGAYMSLAQVLKDKEYLSKAKKIIDANSELILRREQWEKLSKSFL